MCCTGNTIDALNTSTYPGINLANNDDSYFLNHTILSCKNDDVIDINASVLSKFQEKKKFSEVLTLYNWMMQASMITSHIQLNISTP
ncbi:hypothetical protein BDZ94DRAFT_1180403 [Collybia nuda]|uniref:Uncharacterized protein n=1 Tax=Collybia nuda TaxID=64659 RepID=A0A9P5XT53_9AGAR|nr:hypothetical protein BDZ94DRAFT_1180403 [Collybia nuda]